MAWLAQEKKTEKIKRGRACYVLRSANTNKLHALWAGYLKDRFGKALPQGHQTPGRAGQLSSMQTEGKLETRDRVRSIGEQVCDWADAEGDGYNPFRAVKKQLTVNVPDTPPRRH